MINFGGDTVIMVLNIALVKYKNFVDISVANYSLDLDQDVFNYFQISDNIAIFK